MISATLVLLVFILFVYNYYVRNGKNGRLINLIPGPPVYPIIGCIHPFLISKDDVWTFYSIACDTYSVIFKTWYCFVPVVYISHPDDLEVVLSNTKHNKKGFIFHMLRPLLHTGLFTSEEPKWHSRRKLLAHTYNLNIIQQFIKVLIKEGENMITSLNNSGNAVIKDLVPLLNEYMLNAVIEIGVGTSLRDLGMFQQQYREALERMHEPFISRFWKPWLYINWMFFLTSEGREYRKIVKMFEKFTDLAIIKRKFYHDCTNDKYLPNFDNDRSTKEDSSKSIGYNAKLQKNQFAMLDLLIAESRKGHMIDSDIKEEINTFIFMSYNTTMNSMCFTLALLAEHRDIQIRVRNEIRTALQNNGNKFTVELLQDLTYLERCIKESLRLYPTNFMISRIIEKDLKLNLFLIPAGTNVCLNIYATHRNCYFWPNPEVFDPDRFLPEMIQNRHPYSYLPFCAGPRNCIGQEFAMLKMKAIIALVIQHFYLEPIDYLKDVRLNVNFILRPSSSLRVKFTPICKTNASP